MYEKIDKTQYTPMMRQYLDIKEKNQDALVFFRLGDFYEMFFNDALIASKELEIVLTARDAGAKDRVPMCGVPHHSVNSYLDRLTEKGYKVAIVEQITDPKDSKGIVERDVVRIVTPGTVLEGSTLSEKDNNFLLCIEETKHQYILAYTDLSTGENYLTTIPLMQDLLNAEVLKLNTKEIVVSTTFSHKLLDDLKQVLFLTVSVEESIEDIPTLEHLYLSFSNEEQHALKRLFNYILKTQRRTLLHMQEVIRHDTDGYLKVDFASRRNLELLETLRFQNKRNTLLGVLDKCETAMGSRFLKQTILYPFVDTDKINKRLDAIETFQKYFMETAEIKKALSDVYDLERIVGKISYENANPRDVLQLKRSLNSVPVLRKLLTKIKLIEQFDLVTNYDTYLQLFTLIQKSIKEDAPLVIKEGNIIKDGFDPDLDDLKNASLESKDYLLQLETREKERTKIKNLKVGFNRVFGYYIEVSKGNAALVKEEFGYIRKQTLANAERFITEELKERETLILRSEEKMLQLETSLFLQIRSQLKEHISTLQQLAGIIAELDMVQTFARVSQENGYVRPSFTSLNQIQITDGRHPVIEKFANDQVFIPNDTNMHEDDTILLITGPNMSGKSTYMRQVALIAIMAQIGCMVSAKKAILPIFDQIFTRIGAADDIVSGQSTFMVEMLEVNHALKYATNKSLILFDEIGRGTATYDGLALAQSIIEYIHEHIKAKTLFSTHYHELTDLEQQLTSLKNVHVRALEEEGDIVFVHKVLDGAVDKSYGINVAKLAKLPTRVILRANDIMKKLHGNSKYEKKKMGMDHYVEPMIFDSKTEQEVKVLEQITNANLNALSPLEALNFLNELQSKIKK